MDEGRLHRRELPDKPLRENHPRGLGIKDFIMTKILATTPKTWDRTLKVFMMIVSGAKLTGKEGIIPELYKRATQFSPDEKMYTHGTVLPLNVDMVEEGKTAVLPIDLIMDAIDGAEYIARMNRCICRSAHDCSEYEKTLGCLFFNMAGVTAVKNGLAKPVTKEEAKQHVYDARDAGLIGQALYVELEQMVWGFENQKMDEFMEICFCCPCCCVALDVCKNANRTIKNRFSGNRPREMHGLRQLRQEVPTGNHHGELRWQGDNRPRPLHRLRVLQERLPERCHHPSTNHAPT